MAKNAAVLRIRQIRSRIGQTRKQREALLTLGLRRIGQVVEQPDNAAVRGNVIMIGHLLRVEEPTPVNAPAAKKKTTKKTKTSKAGKAKTAAKKKTTKKKTTKKRASGGKS